MAKQVSALGTSQSPFFPTFTAEAENSHPKQTTCDMSCTIPIGQELQTTFYYTIST
ncbi:cubilin [Corchorus olitorius]|uniref:Cubilin n=1 Tax=Corchorus olitorius TaxID=93759 RepID=A0A1R3GVG3_9ROSI|nr:cubilin [Corchorus olitorius]